jgi:hypothetical protein
MQDAGEKKGKKEYILPAPMVRVDSVNAVWG